MTHNERRDILQKALDKAKLGGFVLLDNKHLIATNDFTGEVIGYESIIFDHKFAKALWGDPWAHFTVGQSGDTIGGSFINYLGHLANMAATEDPIEYLKLNS